MGRRQKAAFWATLNVIIRWFRSLCESKLVIYWYFFSRNFFLRMLWYLVSSNFSSWRKPNAWARWTLVLHFGCEVLESWHKIENCPTVCTFSDNWAYLFSPRPRHMKLSDIIDTFWFSLSKCQSLRCFALQMVRNVIEILISFLLPF